MKYGELFHFDPIEAIVQLRTANERAVAQSLVDSYVISDAMAERLRDVVLPQVQFERMEDNKGLFVVGNYGSGKSHLLSVLSAVAEHGDLAGRVRHAGVRDALGEIAGRFRVLRLEIGTTKMSLRDILCAHLEEWLAREGVAYRFPALEEVSGYKRAFEDLMAAFQAKHPDKGLLLVVDELLDFLRQRDDHGVAQDLSFLREIGESCRNLRLRFVAGIQESLFNSERFSFVNDALRRVEARFQQILIERADVHFVIAARLLRKDDAQRDRVRAYLQPFTKYYEGMNERLERFVDLFPIHPKFIEVFDQVPVVEKRFALVTVSAIVRQLQNEAVPADRPGVVSYDRFWETIARNPTLRTVPDLRAVIDCSQTLEERIKVGIADEGTRRLALRILYGLSLQRLAVGGIDRPFGVTAARLRDDLCLYDADVVGLSDEPADDLRDAVVECIRQMIVTVSGQFISKNDGNDQYYLDLEKTADYEALIGRRAESLSDALRDRYWFAAMRVVMECVDTTLVTNFRIWAHEIEWRERRASRRGYLIFGAPNERPTAQPPRDFYLYFMQPWAPPRFRDDKDPKELFFRLRDKLDPAMLLHLHRYAAASELAAGESGSAKTAYEAKAAEARRGLVEWTRQNLTTAFTVTHEGHAQSLGETLKQGKVAAPSGSRYNVRDLVNGIASFTFAKAFEAEAPRYPTFPALITADNRARAALDALKGLRGSPSRAGRSVLEALQLLDGDLVRPKASPIAAHILEALQAKPAGQVLNRAELVAPREGVEYEIHFRLEPEWLAVVLAALVAAGEIAVSVGPKKFDAGQLDALVATPVDELAGFKHIERPRGWNRALLAALCELVELPTGYGAAIADGLKAEDRLGDLVAAANRAQREVLDVDGRVRKGVLFWNAPVLREPLLTQYLERIDALRRALDALLNLRAVGQLKNLQWDEADVRARAADLALVRELRKLLDLVAAHAPAVSWMNMAQASLPEGHPWVKALEARRKETLDALEDPARRADPATAVALADALAELHKGYVAAYLDAHQRARLGPKDAVRRDRLREDPRLAALEALSTLAIFPEAELVRVRDRLGALKHCEGVTTGDLQHTAVCPRCGFRATERPVGDPSAALGEVDRRLDELLAAWTTSLLASLDSPDGRRHRGLLDGDRRGALEVLLQRRALPEVIDPALLDALRAVLRGLEPVVLDPRVLLRTLLPGGSPATAAELRARFEEHLAALTHGKDVDRVRFVTGPREEPRA